MPSIIKVTDLVELTTPADGDFIPIVDISEPVDIDKTKKISVLNLVVAKITAAFAANPLVLRRQGGNSSNWNTAGTTNYSPSSSVRMQVGIINVSTGGTGTGTANVTFPLSFSNVPLVMVSPKTDVISTSSIITTYESVTSSGFTIRIDVGGSGNYNHDVSWLALG